MDYTEKQQIDIILRDFQYHKGTIMQKSKQVKRKEHKTIIMMLQPMPPPNGAPSPIQEKKLNSLDWS
jgi:hypothetical protein